LNAGKVLIAACCGVLALVGAVTATAHESAGHRAHSRVTVEAWPRGLFGYVTSPSAHRCAAHRRVAVFKQRGSGHNPRRDKRIASVRARRNHGLYQWSTRTRKTGRFYAKARGKAGCSVAFSRTISRTETGGGQGGGNGDYPTCSPYVSEGTSSICNLETLRFGVLNDRTCDSFGDTSTHAACYGSTDEGPFPWGRTPSGDHPRAGFYWNWSNHTVVYVAYKPGQSEGYAHLGGTMPGPTSERFTITDGFAQNDAGYPNGDHFYTPDLPGQRAGEVGGPLSIAVNYSGGIYTVRIHGYLYLKS
jgi:hypothetical protein